MNHPIASHENVVLLIDDDPHVHEMVDFHLEGVADRFLHAMNPHDGLRLAGDIAVDVILLDIDMPEMDGFTVCRQLKRDRGTRDIPVLFLTGDQNVYRLVKGLDSGAMDYITKPFNPVELQARVRVALRHKHMFDLLAKYAKIDAVTELSNRAAFDEALSEAPERCLKTSRSLGLLLIEVGHVKLINEKLGRHVGDDALRRVGQTLFESVRPAGRPYALGGDSFAVILMESDKEHLAKIAERACDNICGIKIAIYQQQARMTCNAALVMVPPNNGPVQPSDILREADKVLGLVKASEVDRFKLIVFKKRQPAAKRSR